MTFLWPNVLWLFVLIPALVGAYVWMQRRRRRFALRYSSLSLVRPQLRGSSWLRRHLPALLLLGAVSLLLLAASRPVSIVTLPASKTTIVLAIDVSRSMCSTDIAPNRLEAAKAAALSFVKNQDPNAQIGVVAFSDFAELVQPPTTDQQALETAIQSLLTGRRTAIGSAILKSLDAVAEVDKNVAPSVDEGIPGAQVAPVPNGAYAPDIIVLLTDGASNTGPLPIDAAQQAADRGVRVYAIGFGTPQGSEFPYCGRNLLGNQPLILGGGQFFGGGFGGGGRFRRGIDEATLKQVASLTGAKYYSAGSSGELQQVFRDLPTYSIAKHETTEVTAIPVFAGMVLSLLALMLSLMWHPLP